MTTTEPITWTLSGFGDEIHEDPRIQIAVLKALGARHVEVRSAWGVNVVDLDHDQLQKMHEILAESQMAVSAIGSPIGKVDVSLEPELEIERLRRIIRVAHALETPNIRVFSFFRGHDVPAESVRDGVMTRMRLLATEAEKSGVTLLHENEKGIYGDTPERVLDLVESVGSSSLRVAWDSANFVQVGVKPFTDGYAILRPHLEYLQVKDALFSTGEVVPAGEGDGELRETLTALRDDGYTGFASLEPHLDTAYELGGFSGPGAFGVAARAFRGLLEDLGVETK